MKDIIERCKTTRLLATIGVVGLILGTILPYVKYNILGHSISISLWNYWEGKIVLILALANFLFIFKDIAEKYVPFLFNNSIGNKIQEYNNPKYSLVPTILIAIFAIIETANLGINTFRYYSIGFYSLWIGVICLVAYAIIHKKDESENKM